MIRSIISLCVIVPVIFAASISAQEKTARVQELIAKFPVPAKKDGKLADVDKAECDAAVVELLKSPQGSVVAIVDLLSTKGNDSQARHALHAMVISVGGDKKSAERQAVAKALADTLASEQPKENHAFVVRQLQLIGDEKHVAALGKLLLDEDLAETAAQALLAIKTDAADQFRAALPKAGAKQRPLLAQSLGILKDKASAEPLRKFLDDDNRDTRLTAAWALASLPDAASSERLLKMAEAAKGYERGNLTDSCFRLAQNLVAANDKAAARQIYTRLHESRTDAAERYVKDAAAKGLETTK